MEQSTISTIHFNGILDYDFDTVTVPRINPNLVPSDDEVTDINPDYEDEEVK